jgi:chromosome segregation ATPase
MTPEEIERAIETLLNNQANYELQLERTNQQLERTNQQLEHTGRQVAMLAESQREFMQVVLQHIESQGEINKAIRGSIRDLSNTVERYISEGRNGKS